MNPDGFLISFHSLSGNLYLFYLIKLTLNHISKYDIGLIKRYFSEGDRKMDSILFEPASIKGVQIKNRFVRSATMEDLGTFDGRPSQRLKELYFKLAEGEVGLIITAATIVEGYKNIPKIKGLPSP